MTPAIRAELLFDEREVVVSALNRTMLIDPDSSTQRYLNNPSGYAMWDVNKHRNSHLQASWVYQRQFYTVFLGACRKILYTVVCFTKWWTLLWTAEPSEDPFIPIHETFTCYQSVSVWNMLLTWNSEYRCECGDLWIPNAFIYSTDVSENPFTKSLKPWIKPTKL